MLGCTNTLWCKGSLDGDHMSPCKDPNPSSYQGPAFALLGVYTSPHPSLKLPNLSLPRVSSSFDRHVKTKRKGREATSSTVLFTRSSDSVLTVNKTKQ